MKNYILLYDGDHLEQKYWSLFIKEEFPEYEQFWQKYVVPLTNRPDDIHFKNDAELSHIGKNDHDICIAQLHYTILRHLVRAYEIRQIEPVDLDQFVECLVRLSAATDAADELIERMTFPANYDPWSEKDGEKARRAWREKNTELKYLRDYRNKLVHGRVSPSVLIKGTFDRYRVPKFEKVNDYIDWRKVTTERVGKGGRVRKDFDSPNNLMEKAWKDVLSYFEKNWKKIYDN